MNTTTTSKTVSEAAARRTLGDRNYDIYHRYYSIGRLAIAMARADSEGNTRRADAIHSIIQRRQQEGRL